MKQHAQARLTKVLDLLGIASSSWYQRHKPECDRARPGPAPTPVPPAIEQAVTNRQCYKVMKQHGLLQKKKARAAGVYRTAKLFELLPSGPNELWQMGVTYIHVPGFGWW